MEGENSPWSGSKETCLSQKKLADSLVKPKSPNLRILNDAVPWVRRNLYRFYNQRI
jgi:hypothetical protein